MDDATRRRMVGHRIAEALAAAGMNQSELARRIGNTTPTTIARWVKGEHVPPWDQARRVAQALGVQTAWLLAPVLDDDGDDCEDGPAAVDDARSALLEAQRLIGEFLRQGGDDAQ